MSQEKLLNSNNLKFISKTKKSIGFTIATSLVIIFIFYWFQMFLFGAIVVSAGALIFISYSTGFEIDYINKKYRNTLNLGPIAYGRWIDLPDVAYISVFRTKIVSAVRGLSNTRVSSAEKVIVVNLIYNKTKKLRVLKTENKEEAFEIAKIISEKLDLRVYDATNREGVWLD